MFASNSQLWGLDLLSMVMVCVGQFHSIQDGGDGQKSWNFMQILSQVCELQWAGSINVSFGRAAMIYSSILLVALGASAVDGMETGMGIIFNS